MSKRKDKRWEILVKFFIKIKNLIETNKYVIFFDDELWKVKNFVIDNDQRTIYMTMESPGHKFTQYLFDESEREDNESAKSIIEPMRERLEIFQKINFKF